ncbi:transporter [Shewanella aestuarii]|uniref:Transporter n=1 Tax=Shewanella aestuarii TaxID=1028752 RepID=A0A6G9QLH1_9GAMM|nr:transporter [Shewanella aestuarii]QIR14709.1 transporter [Shewanella aestuarii]
MRPALTHGPIISILPIRLLNNIVLSTGLIAFASNAQDLEPRSYTNIPIGMHFLVAGYVHSEGDLSPAPSVPLQDAKLAIDSAVLAYATTFDFLGSSAKVDLSAAYACADGSATFQGDYVSGTVCGYGDPVAKFTWNFYGAPALTLSEFAGYQEGLVMGLSLQAHIPLGTYDDDKLLNIGTNQWVFRPGIGMSYRKGNWYYGLNATIRFYEDNDDFYQDVLLKKQPQYSIQGHLVYSFTPKQWMSLSANYFFGAETEKNGVASNDDENNSRIGLTYSYAFNRQHSIKVNTSLGVITRVGNDFTTAGVFWLYAF